MSKIREIQTAVAALKLEKSYTEKSTFSQLVKFIAKTIEQARKLKIGPQTRMATFTPTEKRSLKDKVLLEKYNKVMFNPIVETGFKAKDVYDVVSGTKGLIDLGHGVVAPNMLMTTVGVSASLSPLTLALTPIISAGQVFLMAERNFALKDCRPVYQGGKNLNECSCGTCAKGLDFIIERDDGKVARIGLASTVVLAVPVLLYTMGRKMYHKTQGKESEKHKVAQNLWTYACSEGVVSTTEDGTPEILLTRAGCPMAISIINALFEEYERKTNYIQTIAAIAAINGIDKIKALIN